MVVWNDKGEVLASLLERIPLPSEVVILETLTVGRAVQFVHEIGLRSSDKYT